MATIFHPRHLEAAKTRKIEPIDLRGVVHAVGACACLCCRCCIVAAKLEAGLRGIDMIFGVAIFLSCAKCALDCHRRIELGDSNRHCCRIFHETFDFILPPGAFVTHSF
jgi:hypothetical protein